MNNSVKAIISILLLGLINPMGYAKALRSPVQTGDEIIIAKGDIPTPAKYKQTITAYLSYVISQLGEMNQQLEKMNSAIKTKDLRQAQNAYILAHQYYESVRPIIMLFGNTDRVINPRADHYLTAEQDHRFIGFHQIEYLLFSQKDLTKVEPAAEALLAKAKDLKKRVEIEDIQIPKMVQASADFMEMILEIKLAGKENIYSQSDLTDIAANLSGSEVIIKHLTPFISSETLTPINAGYESINKILDGYQQKKGIYLPFSQLTETDKMKLFSLITQQAERLAKLRAIMDVDVYYKY